MIRSAKHRVGPIAGAVVLAIGAMFATTGVALGHEIQREGDCTNSNADWRIEVEHEDGGFQVDVRIRSEVPGQVWRLRIRHDGNLFYDQNRTTNEDGEIRIRRQRPNTAGEDVFRFRATRGDAVCRGGVTHA
jgi:hypothetical protein